MVAFLLWRLYAPLSSWGEIAVGERRGSWRRPSKSATLGLMAAALGIERHERQRQSLLASGYGFAVRVDAPGTLLRDYHTAQTARESDIKKVRKRTGRLLTRRDELGVDDPVTILSRRDYYADALYTIALWARVHAPHTLADLAAALQRPRFALYLGRKSCPPALPLAPAIVEAEHVLAAFAAYRPPEPFGDAALAERLNRRATPPLIAWEEDGPDALPKDALVALHTERRRDLPVDRERWHFSERDEHVGVVKP